VQRGQTMTEVRNLALWLLRLVQLPSAMHAGSALAQLLLVI
jgi:hypothetical protein